MKRSTLLVAVGTLSLLTTSCSNDETTGAPQGSGGSGGATTGAIAALCFSGQHERQ